MYIGNVGPANLAGFGPSSSQLVRYIAFVILLNISVAFAVCSSRRVRRLATAFLPLLLLPACEAVADAIGTGAGAMAVVGCWLAEVAVRGGADGVPKNLLS